MNAPEITSDVFFKLHANYNVAPEANPEDLLMDASCLLYGASATVESIACALSNSETELFANPRSAATMLHGVVHTLSMVNGATEAAMNRVLTLVNAQESNWQRRQNHGND